MKGLSDVKLISFGYGFAETWRPTLILGSKSVVIAMGSGQVVPPYLFKK